MAADRPLPINAGRIRLDAPCFTRFVAQTLEPTPRQPHPLYYNMTFARSIQLRRR